MCPVLTPNHSENDLGPVEARHYGCAHLKVLDKQTAYGISQVNLLVSQLEESQSCPTLVFSINLVHCRP